MPSRIKDWHKFQHFKDRRPPWIKLHRDILDQRDINMISDRAFRVLVNLWLIASEDVDMQGKLPDIDELAWRLRLEKASLISALGELDRWIEMDDIKAISGRYQDDIPETETERETKAEEERETDTVASCEAVALTRRDDLTQAVDAWNDLASRLGLAKVQRMTDTRKAKLRKRLFDAGGINGWFAALEKVEASAFLRGDKTSWKADFDFMLQESSFTKLMEGGYDGGRDPPRRSAKNTNEVFDWLDRIGEEHAPRDHH